METKDVLAEVSELHSIPVKEITAKSKVKKVLNARREYVFLLLEIFPYLSQKDVAIKLGLSSSDVGRYVQIVTESINNDPYTKKRINFILNKFKKKKCHQKI